MTVNSTNITSGPYIGNGTLDEYSYDFRIEDETQLDVYETDDAGNQILLVLTTDYTVAGVGVDGGGNITRVAGNLPTDYEWYIRSDYPDTQLTAFESQGGFFPDVHEAAFDKATFVSQQQDDRLRRSLKLSDSDSSAETADMNLPVLADRISQLLGFDASGNPIAAAGSTPGGVTVSPFMATVVDDADAAAAFTTLGVTAFIQTLFDDVNAAAALATLTALGINANLSDLANAATSRTNLGVAIGSDVQAYNALIDILAQPSLSVHKNNVNQTGVVTVTWTKVTWSTEEFDTNSDFASDRFTPTVAGKYILTGTLAWTATNDQGNYIVSVYKNGALHRIVGEIRASGTSNQGTSGSVVVDANGSTDYFEIYVWQDSGSDKIIDGTSENTHFSGMRVGS